MNIVSLIETIAAAITGPPVFYHGEKAFQNLQDETNIENGVVYLDEPITSNDNIKQSGYIEEVYPLKILFAKKSELDWTTTEHQTVIQECRELRRQFLVLLQNDDGIRGISNARTTEIKNIFDINLSGVYLELDVTPFNTDTNCAPGEVGLIAAPVTEPDLNPFSQLAGSSLDNLGALSYREDEDWNGLMEEVGFTQVTHTGGAQSNWTHQQSSTGHPEKVIVTPRVGIGANIDEIEYFTEPGSVIALAEQANNATGVDFFTANLSYAAAHNQTFLYTANIAHGTIDEFILHVSEIIAAAVTWKVRLGNESPAGSSGPNPNVPLTSDQYMENCQPFVTWMNANHPAIGMVVDMAPDSGVYWDNAEVTAWAIINGIEEVRRYHHFTAASTEPNIDVYFAAIIPQVVADIAVIMGDIAADAVTFYGLKSHLAQYGSSIQNTGLVTATILHGIFDWKFRFEVIRFNAANDNFVKSMILLENEHAASFSDADNDFDIDTGFVVTNGSGTYVKRVIGVAFELMRRLYNYNDIPVLIPVTIVNGPVGLDVIAVQFGSEIELYCYNQNTTDVEIASIELDGIEFTASVNVTGIWGEQPYASIGSSPAYQYFKNVVPLSNPGLVAVNVQRISETVTASAMVIKKISTNKLLITGAAATEQITFIIEGGSMSINTVGAVDMLNIFGSTAFDMSIENTMVGQTQLMSDITDLNLGFLAGPGTGQVLLWRHAGVSADGWGSLESDAIARGKNYQTEQQGDLWNGGVPYGRNFYNEYCYMAAQTGQTKIAIGVNCIMPLIPFSGTTINWTTINIGALIAEINIDIAQAAALCPSAVITFVEIGQEYITSQNNDLFVNTGGAETTKGTIMKKLLEHTNGTSAVSILQHLRTVLPNAILSIHGKLWDDLNNNQPDMNPVQATMDIDVIEQYYQYQNEHCTSYITARARVAERSTFWTFINHANFNGKGVFISQLTMKLANVVRDTIANGLIMIETYMKMTEDNLANNNKLKGMVFMNLKQLFNVNTGYPTKVVYPFIKMCGRFYDDSQQKITVTTDVTEINENCLLLGIQIGNEIRIQVLNPTGNTYSLNTINLNGVGSGLFTSTSLYCTDATNPITVSSTEVTESQFLFRPYSITVLIKPAS